MKNNLIFTVILFCFVGTLQAEPVIKLGVVAPLSGDFAYQGNFIQSGVEIAVKELRASGKTIKVSYEDACFPKDAITSARKLVSEKIHALVGSYCIIGMVPMSSIFERAKLLSFQTSVVPDVLLGSGGYVLSTNAAIEDEAKTLARLAYQELDARRAGIFSFPSDWGQNYSEHFAAEFQKQGGVVIGNELSQISQMDFRPELTKMKAKEVDVIFGAHISSALGIIVKQARQLGIKAEFLSTNETEDPQFFEAAGKAAEGTLIFTPEPLSATEVRKGFLEKYQRRYKSLPPVTASNAYDATHIAVQAIERCNFQPECMKDYAYSIQNYDGGSGIFSIEADGRTRREFVKKIARGGQFIRVE